VVKYRVSFFYAPGEKKKITNMSWNLLHLSTFI